MTVNILTDDIAWKLLVFMIISNGSGFMATFAGFPSLWWLLATFAQFFIFIWLYNSIKNKLIEVKYGKSDKSH